MPDEANLNLVQKLAKIREMVEVLRKNNPDLTTSMLRKMRFWRV